MNAGGLQFAFIAHVENNALITHHPSHLLLSIA
jgi:hypothetical protein